MNTFASKPALRVLLAAAFAASLASARTGRVGGGIEGVVVDPSGAVAPGTTIIVEQPDKGFERLTVSDASGRFSFQGLPSDEYRLYDDASDFDEHPLDPFDFSRDWALSAQHQAHRIAAGGLFELPADDWDSAPDWVRESLEDVVVSPIITFGDRRPVNALLTTDAMRTGAFPISARPAGTDRNSFFGPRTVNLDLRLMKGFWVKEGRAILRVGVEAFDLLNHSNALRVSPFFQAGRTRLGSYRDAVETLNARRIQWLVQFEY